MDSFAGVRRPAPRPKDWSEHHLHPVERSAPARSWHARDGSHRRAHSLPFERPDMQPRAGWRWSTLLLSLGLAACTGIIGEGAPAAGGDPAAAGARGTQGGQSLTTCSAEASPPGPMYLRRLTNQEYAATVRDLLGVEPKVDTLPPDLTLHGFDNNAESISISTAHLEGYRALAETLASDLVAHPPRGGKRPLDAIPSSADGATCLETSFADSGFVHSGARSPEKSSTRCLRLPRPRLRPKGPWIRSVSSSKRSSNLRASSSGWRSGSSSGASRPRSSVRSRGGNATLLSPLGHDAGRSALRGREQRQFG